LRATTGFQNRNYTQLELLEHFSEKLNIYNTNKTIEFLQSSLNSSIDIIKHGGQVTRKYSDRKFSLLYDNRREIIDLPLIQKLLNNININNNNNNYNNNDTKDNNNTNTNTNTNNDNNNNLNVKGKVNDVFIKTNYNYNYSENDNKFRIIKDLKDIFNLSVSNNVDININNNYNKTVTTNNNNNNNNNNVINNCKINNNNNNEINNNNNNKYYILLDSLPLIDSDKCFNIRSIANRFRVNDYNQRTSKSQNTKYKDYTDLAIRNFIKCLLMKPSMYPEIALSLKDYSSIIKFIKVFKVDYRISKQSISNLKHRPLIKNQVPRSDETLLFVNYVKSKYNHFDENLFFSK